MAGEPRTARNNCGWSLSDHERRSVGAASCKMYFFVFFSPCFGAFVRVVSALLFACELWCWCCVRVLEKSFSCLASDCDAKLLSFRLTRSKKLPPLVVELGAAVCTAFGMGGTGAGGEVMTSGVSGSFLACIVGSVGSTLRRLLPDPPPPFPLELRR